MAVRGKGAHTWRRAPGVHRIRLEKYEDVAAAGRLVVVHVDAL